MNAEQYRRLRWRCRRGLLELDLLLGGFLERHHAELSATDCARFERLLAMTDQELLAWCSGDGEPPDPELIDILKKVLQ